MASIAKMIGGAILNATSFIGGSYLAKYISGDETDKERERHDKALEKYQKDYQKYIVNKQKFEEWKEENMRKGEIAKQNFVNTDEFKTKVKTITVKNSQKTVKTLKRQRRFDVYSTSFSSQKE